MFIINFKLLFIGVFSLILLCGCSEETSNIIKETSSVERTLKTEEDINKVTDEKINVSDLVPVEFVRIVDGDTIKVIYEGEEKSVRYLLVDTPETKHPKVGKQPFGQEASDYNNDLLTGGKEVSLEFDIGQRIDKYGRLLAYVYVDGKNVNEELVKKGLARVGYIYAPNTRHLDRFEKAQRDAKGKGIGIWSVDSYVDGEGFKGTLKSSVEESKTGTLKSADKNSLTESVKDISEPIEAKEFFVNCTGLREMYPEGVAKGHPAYSSKMDRDKDDFACEKN